MKWFRRNRHPRPMSPDRVDSDDPMMRAAVAEAYNTGGSIIAVRHAGGTFEVRPADEVRPTHEPEPPAEP